MGQLDEVVEEPDRPAGDRREEDGQPGDRVAAEHEERGRRGDDDQQPTHRRRPLLDDVPLRALLANELAELLPAQVLDESRAEQDREEHRHDRGDDDAGQTRAPASASATTSSPTARDALTSTQSPGLEQLFQCRDRLVDAGDAPDRRDLGLPVSVVLGEWADREQDVDAHRRRVAPDLAVVAGSVRARARPCRRAPRRGAVGLHGRRDGREQRASTSGWRCTRR